MRKKLLLMLILFLSAAMVRAERIDVSTARRVAENVVNTGSGLRSAEDLSLVYAAAPGKSSSALRSGAADGAADYFVFNVPGGKGFVIVSGEDRVLPVFGYSDEGTFNPESLPDNLRYMLAYYQNQVAWAEASAQTASPDIQAEWSRYLGGTNRAASAPKVLLETAKWNQQKPYNGMTPLNLDEHAPTGCVATAQAIIMRYHQYPERAIGGVSSYRDIPITYDKYDWANMPLTYPEDGYGDARDNAVAKLMWHCGANVKMDYGLLESGAVMKRAAKSYAEVFGYSPSVRYLAKEAYRWDEWKAMIRQELDAGYPVSYGGQTSKGEGHAFVCDGYDDRGFFHINWGWGGSSDGFFALSVLDPKSGHDGYSDGQDMILNIRPSRAGEKYVYKPVVKNISYTGPLPLVGEFSIPIEVRYTGFEDLSYCVELAVVDSLGKILESPSESEPSTYEADTDYSFDFNMSLETPLGKGLKIVVIGSPNGHDWEVMRCLTTSPTGLDNKGLIKAPADNPGDPVLVSILKNQFDDAFLNISGLDNSQSNLLNTNAIAYSLTNVTENLILRYTLKDYAAWKGKLAVYYGDDSSISEGNQGTKAVIGEGGSFDVPVSLAQISDQSYENHLKVLSARQGELSYDIQVCLASAPANPIFKEENKAMRFLEALSGSITPRPIMGAKNAKTPFTYTIGNTNQWLNGKPLDVKVSISNLNADQVKLYYVSAGQEREIPLKSDVLMGCQTEEDLALGALSDSASYTFKVEVDALTDDASITLTPTVKDAYYRAESSLADLRITDAPAVTHAITTALTNLVAQKDQPTVIETGKDLFYKLECDKEHYILPDTIQVKMGTKELNVATRPEDLLDAECTYDPTTGDIWVKNVTADVLITATGVEIFHVEGQTKDIAIETSGEPLKIGEPFKCKLAPADGYKPPYAIKVMMGGRLLKQRNLLRAAGSDYYTYDNTTGALEIENVDGEIVIEAKGVEKGYFEVIPNLTNLTTDPVSIDPMAKDSKVELTLKAAAGYTLPAAITVKMGENTLVASTDYTYNAVTGAFSLEKITNTLVITAAGDRIPDPEPEPEPTPTTYTVTLPVVEGATLTAESSTSVESGQRFAFTLTLKTGYSAPQLAVKANGSVLTPVSSDRYVIEEVTSDIVVTVTGIVKDNPTGNAEVDPNGLRVWGENGRLHIQTPIPDTAYIVTFDGRSLDTLSLPAGETVTNLPQGSYIINIGEQSYKIRF
ncbi:MAG: C10 family peptidase [Parabacteroides sp.]|nr:C10 family peptidase [Parabacteroides sp.]